MTTYDHDEHAKLRWITEVAIKDFKQKYVVSDHTAEPTVLVCPYVPMVNAEVESRLLHIFLNRLGDSALFEKSKQERYAMTLQPEEEFRFGRGIDDPTPLDTPTNAVPPTTGTPSDASSKVRKPKKQVRKKASANGSS